MFDELLRLRIDAEAMGDGVRSLNVDQVHFCICQSADRGDTLFLVRVDTEPEGFGLSSTSN